MTRIKSFLRDYADFMSQPFVIGWYLGLFAGLFAAYMDKLGCR